MLKRLVSLVCRVVKRLIFSFPTSFGFQAEIEVVVVPIPEVDDSFCHLISIDCVVAAAVVVAVAVAVVVVAIVVELP
jgi:hypothetical protein